MAKEKSLTTLKKVVIREELVALTGDYREAVVLGQFIYWSQRMNDFDEFITEENTRIAKFLSEDQQQPLEATNGWIYKTATQLGEECMLVTKTKSKSSQIGDNTILGYIDSLVKNCWIEKRANPKYKWDKTIQYRVNLVKVFSDLLDIGYILQDYKVGAQLLQQIQKTKLETEKNENADSKNENQGSNNENQGSNNENHGSNNENHGSNNEEQYQRLLTETTAETTTEITTETTDREKKETLPPPTDGFDYKMKWLEALTLIKPQLTDVSFNTWITPLTLCAKEGNLITLSVEDIFAKDIVEGRYSAMLKNAYERVALESCELKIVVNE